MSGQYFKLKNSYIIDIDSSNIQSYETLQYSNNATPPQVSDFLNDYRIHLNIPVEFSRNCKIAIDEFDLKILLAHNQNEFIVETVNLFTPSISVKNQYLSSNKAHLKLFSKYFDNQHQVVTVGDGAGGFSSQNNQSLIYHYKNNDLQLNSFELRSSDFAKNELVLTFQNKYTIAGSANVLLNHGLVKGSEFNLRLIIYDYDEDQVNYTPPEATIKNLLPMSNTGINKIA